MIYCLMRMIVKLCRFSVLQHCHVRPYQQAFVAISNHRQSRSLDLENCVLGSVLCKCVDLLHLELVETFLLWDCDTTAARASFMDWPPFVRKRCITEDRKIMNVIDHCCYYHHYYYYYDHKTSTERDTKASVLVSQI